MTRLTARDGEIEHRARDAADPPPVETERPHHAPEALSRVFVEGMRSIAATVTVVTTDGPAGRHGATVSAFASVSADPPTLLVCLRSASRICTAALRNRTFTVTALAEPDSRVARIFAGEFDTADSNRFASVSLASFPGLAPGISGGTCFACRLVRSIDQHTHTILIGSVLRVATARRPPLLYHDRGYGRFVRDAAA